MSNLGDFHFIRPAWLLLAPVITWIWWRVRADQDPLRGWRQMMDPELLDVLIVAPQANPARERAVHPDGGTCVRIPGTVGDFSPPGGWPCWLWQDRPGVPNRLRSPMIPYR